MKTGLRVGAWIGLSCLLAAPGNAWAAPQDEDESAESDSAEAISDEPLSDEVIEPPRQRFRERVPLNAVVLVDVSKSMRARERRLPFFWESLKRFVFEQCGDNDTIRFVNFDSGRGFSRPSEATTLRLLGSAIRDATERLRSAPEFHERTILLITDVAPSQVEPLEEPVRELQSAGIRLVEYHLGRSPRALASLAYLDQGRGFVEKVPGLLALYPSFYNLLAKQAAIPHDLEAAGVGRTMQFSMRPRELYFQLDVMHGRLGRSRMQLQDALGETVRPYSLDRYHRQYRLENPPEGKLTLSLKGDVKVSHFGVTRVGSYRAATEGNRAVENEPMPDYMLEFDPNASTFFGFETPTGGDPAGVPIHLVINAEGGPMPTNVSLQVEVTRPDETKEMIAVPRVAKRRYEVDYTNTDVAGKYSFKMSYSPGYTAAQMEEQAELDTNEAPASPPPQKQKRKEPKGPPEPEKREGKSMIESQVEAAPDPEAASSLLATIGGGALGLLVLGGIAAVFLMRRKRQKAMEEALEEELEPTQRSAPAAEPAEVEEEEEEEPEESIDPDMVAIEGETPEDAFLSPVGEEEKALDKNVERFVRSSTHTFTALFFDLIGEKWTRGDGIRILRHEGSSYGAYIDLHDPSAPGRVGLLFNESGGAGIARAMLGFDEDEEIESDFVTDAILEFLNLYVGKLKMQANDERTKIGLPVLLEDASLPQELFDGAYQLLKLADKDGQAAIVWRTLDDVIDTEVAELEPEPEPELEPELGLDPEPEPEPEAESDSVVAG